MRWLSSSVPPRPVPRRRPLIGFWFLLLLAAPASAACDSTETCLAAIDAVQAGTQTLTARFTQTKHVSLLDEPIVSTGRFAFKRPDRVRLDIETPHAATVLVNGRQVSIPGLSDAERQQLAMGPMAAMFAEFGAMFSGSRAALSKNFEVVAQPAEGGIAMTLTPTLPEWQRLFRTIALRFSGPDLVMHSMRLDDALGDRLEIVMTDVQRNADLPDTLFTIPPSP